MNNTPYIFDIVRGSFDDGPGIRTTVFFKGCPLKCSWCHNPESQLYRAEIAWNENSCIKCNACKTVCPNGAISDKDSHRINRILCIGCGKCVDVCVHALKRIGTIYSPEGLVEILMRDKVFYDTSGGGVTFSGGEPFSHLSYLLEVCRELKKQGIHLAAQTSGFFNYELFEQTIQPYINIIYFDLKIINRNQHFFYTGQYNDLILKNLRKLASYKQQKLIVRTPLIPKITATDENMAAIKTLLADLKIDEYETLEYNPMGQHKYTIIGKKQTHVI